MASKWNGITTVKDALEKKPIERLETPVKRVSVSEDKVNEREKNRSAQEKTNLAEKTLEMLPYEREKLQDTYEKAGMNESARIVQEVRNAADEQERQRLLDARDREITAAYGKVGNDFLYKEAEKLRKQLEGLHPSNYEERVKANEIKNRIEKIHTVAEYRKQKKTERVAESRAKNLAGAVYGLYGKDFTWSDAERRIAKNNERLKNKNLGESERRYLEAENKALNKNSRELKSNFYSNIPARKEFNETKSVDRTPIGFLEYNKKADFSYGFVNDLNVSDGRRVRDLAMSGVKGNNAWVKALGELTAEEKGIYNYLCNTEGSESGLDYLYYLEPELNKRVQYGKDLKIQRDIEKSNAKAALFSAGTVAAAPVRAIAGLGAAVEDTVKVLSGEEIDPYSAAHSWGNTTGTIRGNTKNKMPGFWGKLVYDVSMSVGDNVANSLAFGGVAKAVGSAVGMSADGVRKLTGNIVSAAMSADSTANAIVYNKQRGLSDERALALAFAQGLVEFGTEKMAIDEILKAPKSSLGRAMAVGGISEGTEELTSGAVNMALDFIVTGSDSDIVKLKDEYVKKGYGESSALIFAIAESLGEQTLAGIVSGAAMSGGFRALGFDGGSDTDEDVKTDGPDILYQIEDEDGKILNTDDKSGKIEIERKSAIETKIKYSPNGLKLPAEERERLFSRISTDYYHTNKTHEGLQYQSVVTDSEHLLYVYQDGGFGHYNVLARVDYQNEFAAKRITEEIDNGRIYEISKVIDRVLESPEIRQSGYNVYNALTKKRRRTIGDASLYSRQSEGNTGRVDAGGNGNSRSGNRNVSDFDKVIAMGDNDYAETVRKRSENADVQDDVLSSIESVESHGKSGITYDDMMSGNITEEVRTQKENFEGAVGRAGFRVVYATDRNVPKGTVGYVDFSNREIYISPEHFSESLLNHELTHVIDRGYDGKYVKSLISFFKEEMSKDWNDAEQAIRDKYEKIAEENPGFTYSERTIEAETLAEMCEKFSTDKYIKSAANMKTGAIRQMAVMFRYMWSKMLYHFGDNSEARRMKIASMKWQMALYRAVNEGKANSTGIAFSSNVEEYPYNMQTVIKEYLEFKDEGLYDMVKAFRNDPKTSIRSYVMGDVAERLAAGINEKIGVDVREFSCAINKNGVEHIENNHGVNGKTDKSMANMNDTARIPYVLNNFDTIEVLYEGEKPALSKVYKNADNSKAQMVRISKKINGTFYTVLAVPDSANKRVWVVSAYINKNDGITQDSNANTALETTPKSELASLPSDDIIPQTSEKYNKNISTDDDMLFAVADDEGSAGQDSGSKVRDASALEEEIGIIDEALQDKTLDKEDRMNLIKDRIRLKRELSAIEGEKNEDKPTMREKTLDEYKRTGDVGVLPSKESVVASEKYDKKKISELSQEYAEIQEALRTSQELNDGDVEELKMRRDAVVTRLKRLGDNNTVLSEIEGILDELSVAEEPDHRWVSEIAEELTDKQNVIKYGTYNQNDIERNFRHFFGKHFKKAYDKIIQPLYDSKKDYVAGVKEYAERLKTDVVDGLGIEKGSRESAAVMWLGEGKRPLSKKELVRTYGKDGAKKKIAEAKAEGLSEVFVDYTYDDCVKDFGKETAQNIQKATEVFRKMYDELIADVNKTRSEIYPNNPDKLVKKRTDYFHHFQEMSKGFTGLRNILSTNIGIDPMLVGTSEHTKPKSKWAAYMQERTGKRTEYDAVAGFLDYIPAAQYSIHIDPNIVNVRALAKELALAKATEYDEHGNPDANGFIAYLQKYANSLAGKTVSHFDRAVNDSNFGRTATAVVGWLNNKTKASAVLGNINSVLSQVTNMKNVIGKIENQADVIRGAVDALGGLNPDGKISARYKESGFLGERYLDKTFSRFDTKWQKMNPVKWAADVLGFADEIGTRITWNAGYNEAVRKNIANPVQYADNFTRACVAGRGIGEEALVFKSQLGKMFLPFRTEVLNDLRVQQDILFGRDDSGKGKAIGKRIKNIMQLYIASMVINAALAALKSDEFDPFEEAKEGADEGGILGALESVLRDYADGAGDPVAFDPIYDIVTGVYQGVNEGESAGGKVGKAVQRTVQNVSGDYVSNNPFSSAVMGIAGIDSDASDMLFNGKVYSPGGMGMPLASNMSTVFRELSQGDILSAGVAAIKPFFPLGTQVDRSVKGIYDYSKGYATTEAAYERMTGQEGDLKYLIKPGVGNAVRSVLLGPGAFSGESDAFYNDKTRKFTEEEQARVLSSSDYESRKVTFDEILAGRAYNTEKDKRKTAATEKFYEGLEGTVLYELYSSGEEAAVPYKNMGVTSSYTDSKTKKKYELKLSAKEAESITDDVCAVIAKRFDRANESEVFGPMTPEEQAKYLNGVKEAEYDYAKVKALHDSGQMSDEDFFRLESNYKRGEAERDRKLYVDDASVYVEYNAADTIGQYATYTDVPISEEGYEQLSAWSEYASTRKADEVDKELMRLSNATDSSINVSGNPYGIINYTKSGIEYKISMPDNKIYALCDEVDRAVRSGLVALFKTATYKSASDDVRKKLVSSTKSKVRDNLRDSYKARYKSVKIDDFDKVINMGK